jgi:methyl-accepting chemotaxis protein
MSLFRSRTLGVRLAAGIGFILLLGLVSAVINAYYLARVKSVAASLKEEVIPLALLAEEMAGDVQSVQQFLTDAGLTRNPESLKRAAEAADRFRQGAGRFRAFYEKRGDGDGGGRMAGIEEEFDGFYADGQRMAQAYMAGAAAHQLMEAFDRDAGRLATSIATLRDGRMTEAGNGLLGLMTSVDRSASFIWTLAFAALAAGVVVALLITRSVTGPIRATLVFTDRVAEGDLTTTIGIQDGGEIGTLAGALNGMVGRLREMMARVIASTAELKQVSQAILCSSAQVSQACEVQSVAVEGTSASIMQIDGAIAGISQGVDRLSVSAQESSSSVLQLAASIEEVALTTDTLASSAEGISRSTAEMTAASRQIDGNVAALKDASATTAVSVAEMDATIRQVEESAQSAATITTLVLSDAEEGKKSVEATITGIGEIRRSSAITVEVIDDLSRRAREIDAILAVIDEVAAQTNLLALNAAIIAAQAGDQGKGFSVVAEEIKQLADRTSHSTREIAELIKGVQQGTERAVQAIRSAEASIAEGESLSGKSGEALAKICDGTSRAASQVAEIARATLEQGRGSAMIRQAMENVSEMIDQISVATAEQSRGSELIAAEIRRMRDLTAQVKNSTREQNSTASMISRLTTEINELIGRIKRACDEQSRGSAHIVSAAGNVRESTASNGEACRMLEEAVAALGGEIAVLEQEMGRFRVS